jgi:hypothetical protein
MFYQQAGVPDKVTIQSALHSSLTHTLFAEVSGSPWADWGFHFPFFAYIISISQPGYNVYKSTKIILLSNLLKSLHFLKYYNESEVHEV